MTALGKDSLTSATIPTLHTFKYLWLLLHPWPIETPNLYITSICEYVLSVISKYLSAPDIHSYLFPQFPQFHMIQSAMNNNRTKIKKDYSLFYIGFLNEINCELNEFFTNRWWYEMIYTMTLHACHNLLQTIFKMTIWYTAFLYFTFKDDTSSLRGFF